MCEKQNEEIFGVLRLPSALISGLLDEIRCKLWGCNGYMHLGSLCLNLLNGWIWCLCPQCNFILFYFFWWVQQRTLETDDSRRVLGKQFCD